MFRISFSTLSILLALVARTASAEAILTMTVVFSSSATLLGSTQVAAGVYFIRLATARRTLQRQVVILR